jgi:Rrf2 family iron-sulfur cluster assembly transcriptional regulator
MFIYGKTATNGIAVMSYLAAVSPRRAGSAEIAKERCLSRVLTAKLLTQLSSAGLVTGQPGPGGGYTLARAANEIRLIDIVCLFSLLEDTSPCPFGARWCGNHTPCPLHDTIAGMIDRSRDFLEHTRLSIFQAPPATPAQRAARATRTSPAKAAARAAKSRAHP